ncbi:NAD(P)/FAD-dependent oxidoreductase [Actinomyces minihominis]|uniref:NAD(P)/FAD-dependent oxidoreductase n=1 Tax=Actinomyces minihominis TaxID=2002838 RepID=UPI000C06C6B5|nr:FAD-dependent oxidoreductase [Actinomyces minihominis]
MDNLEKVVIIGGGLAGAKTAEALRKKGFAGTIDLVDGEDHLPYERPPLSKTYLAGEEPFEKALVHTGDWYGAHEVTLHQNRRATGIDIQARTVALDDGQVLPYDKLVLATGSAARHLPLEGAEASNVHYLRTVDDAEAIRATFGVGRRLVLIGGGWIGLEVAAVARTAGTAVTILEAGKLPLIQVVGEEVAEVFANLHRRHGVDLRTNVKVVGIETCDGMATGVRLEDGEVVEADAIVIGIGTVPRLDLAGDAGLAVDNGVLVDAELRTSDPDIFAVGDIANQDHPILGYRVRVEHWATALNQPKTVATTILGQSTPYTELPYFYTDQYGREGNYELSCEYIGHVAQGVETRLVVRGDLDSLEFVAFWLDLDNHLLAVMPVNTWDVIDQVKGLIADRRMVDPAKLANSEVPYSSL